MRAVWKYKLSLNELGEITALSIPSRHSGGDARIVHFAAMDDGLYVWVDVDIDAGSQGYLYLSVVGTGQEIPAGAKHKKTVIDGYFVWHLYQVPNP